MARERGLSVDAETGEGVVDVASLGARKKHQRSAPLTALIVGILALAALYIAIFGAGSLNFFIYGTIGIGLVFEYGWIGVILRSATTGDHDYEDAQGE